MPTTNFSFPYPGYGDLPDGPDAVKDLADAVDAKIKELNDAQTAARVAGDTIISSSRRQATAQSLTNNVFTTITFDTSELNEIPWTTDHFTVPTAGYYQINAALIFATNSTGIRGIRITVNATAIAQSQGAAGTTGNGASVSRCLKLAAGDSVSIQGFQNSGGALTVAAAAGQNFVDITRLTV